MNSTESTHPTLEHLRSHFAGKGLQTTTFRNRTTVVVPSALLHDVMQFLHDHAECHYDFLSDVTGIDYLGYPAAQPARFAVVYLLASTTLSHRITVKTYLDPSIDTSGIESDPALELDSVTDIWPGAEWPEREVYDMFGIRFRNHPDLRRILTWKEFPAHPLRKDYPLHGRGERELYRVINRDDA